MSVDTHSARITLPPAGPGALAPPPPKRGTPSSIGTFVRSLPITLLVHGLGLALSWLLATRWVGALEAATGTTPTPGADLFAGGALAMESWRAFSENALPNLIVSTLGMFWLWSLSSIGLQVLWLRAMTLVRPSGIVAVAATLGRALLVSLALVGPLLFSLAFVIGLPALWHLAFRADPDPRWHDVGMLACLLPGTLLFAAWATVKDLAYAGVVRGDRVMLAIYQAWRERDALGRYLGYAIVGLACGWGTLWLGDDLSTALGAQALLLVRTLSRAGWLAHATVRLPPQD